MKAENTAIYEFGGFRLDAAKRLLQRADGEIVPLTPKVFETLLYLVRNGGKIVEKDELLQAVWTDTIVEENNLSQNISALRKLFGEKRGYEQRDPRMNFLKVEPKWNNLRNEPRFVELMRKMNFE